MTEEMTLDDKARIAWGWWRKLNPPPDSTQSGDRAALAMLRRAAEPRDIWLIDAYQDLRQRLHAGNDHDDRVAVLADRKVVVNAPLAEVEHFDHPWVQEYFHGPRARAARATRNDGAPRQESD